jgi:hypothetical protein
MVSIRESVDLLLGRVRISKDVCDLLQVFHVTPLVSRNGASNELPTPRVLWFVQVSGYVNNSRLLLYMQMATAEFQLFIWFDLLRAFEDLRLNTYPSVLYDGLAVQS